MTRRAKRRTPEGILLDQIEARLDWHPGIRWWRNSPGKLRGYRVAHKGAPDIFFYVIGSARFGAIEVKTAAGELSPEQRYWLATAHDDGVTCGVARSVEDAVRIIGEAVERDAP